MKLGRDGFWNAENNGEIQEMYNFNVNISTMIPEPYRKAIGVEYESTAVLAWDTLVGRYMQQVEVTRADAEHCVATNLAFFVTGNYPVEIVQRVMRLYPLCRTTSFGRLVPMPAENEPAPSEPDRAQLEKIMDCEDRDWDYFARTDPTPKARDFVSSGDGGLYWPQVCLGGSIDSFSVVDCETGEEMLKPPSDADIASWSKPAGPYVVESQSDDNYPLTVKWLDSVRPSKNGEPTEWQIADTDWSFDVSQNIYRDRFVIWITDNHEEFSAELLEVKTRGEVRAICRALKTEVPK